MEAIVNECLRKIQFGALQQHENMAVVPLLLDSPAGPEYLTLKQALDESMLSVVEVSEGGSVPELKVVNKAQISVLLLDGEELVGAKQNRVLNTSILLQEESETIIPVSCTEHGRWSYSSREFADSDVVMSPSLRMRKARSVSESLTRSREFRSDQSEVWNEVAHMSARAGAASPTGAMRAAYQAREADLNGYLAAFEASDGQKGLLIMIDGDVVGLDLLSREEAYVQVHGKLVKSYAMDAVLAAQGKDESKTAALDTAKAFVEEAAGCEEEKHKSVGHGWDRRLKGPRMVGSALTYQESVIHAAFFRADKSDMTGPMSSSARRRRFRT